MIKTLIKEVFIIILLAISILLILSICFYEYRPSTYKIPVAVQEYSLPQEMQDELDETIKGSETQNIVQIYKVDGQDLKNYEKTNDYKAGKINPFSVMSKTEETTDKNTTSNNTTGGGSNQTTNTGSQGSFLNTIK